MPRTPEVPEEMLARHVNMHVRAAATNLTTALRPMRARRVKYAGSPLFKAMEDAERAAILAEKEAGKWNTRTAKTGDLFNPAEGES